jgi:hypothetical protein
LLLDQFVGRGNSQWIEQRTIGRRRDQPVGREAVLQSLVEEDLIRLVRDLMRQLEPVRAPTEVAPIPVRRRATPR